MDSSGYREHRKQLLEEKSLGLLLQACPSLKIFTYDRRCNVGDEPELLHCASLTTALHHVKGTLEELDFGVLLYSDYAEEVEYLEISPVLGHLGPLDSFKVLHKLKVPVAVLLGWFAKQAPSLADILPGSLSHLCLTEDLSSQCTYEWSEELVLQKLQPFFAAARQTTPRLKTFELLPCRDFDRWAMPLEDRLRAMCSQHGITCIIPENK
ncbi:hypothetical protein EYZ11_007310 [Aspergillus tanneri]|uniref:Uncharacterized protein n=1 Tax=Aspergillus tanneri TaxID=1220188 RepID=A0A4S3JDR8_9EURO|nr:hypothetical protein EYZ11_007310 [Aspergillus tanneri]